MLFVAGKGDIESCRRLAAGAIEKRTALKKLVEMVIRQGGDPKAIEDTAELPKARFKAEWKAETAGYIEKMHAEKLGYASLILGAGRKNKDDVIDHSAGIELVKKPSDKVERGETLAFLHTSDENRIPEALSVLETAVSISSIPVQAQPLILGRIE